MIVIGADYYQKHHIINFYIEQYKIKKIYVFSPDEFKEHFQVTIKHEHVPYTEIIMYRTFYRLLEEIDNESLLVFNECLRTQNRHDLTYSCAHHYCSRTKHKLVFEYFPFIENHDEYMILLDFIDKYRFKSIGFDWSKLHEVELKVYRKQFKIIEEVYYPSEAEISSYEKEKNKLFSNLGNKHPDTIPRELHMWTGQFRKQLIKKDRYYVVRNKRLKLNNVKTYQEIKNNETNKYIIFDFAHRRIDMNDFLKKTKQYEIEIVRTDFKIDKYYTNELKN